MSTDRAAFTILILHLFPILAFGATPHIIISVEGATLRLERGAAGRQVFPIGVGRVAGAHPLGLWRTGPDPDDQRFYIQQRWMPALHQGLPFIRLDTPRLRRDRGVTRPFGIHGPVTPSLIWGQVSAGCIRMRAADIRSLFEFARRHPGLRVKVIRDVDLAEGKRVAPDGRGPVDPRCPAASVGVRRLRRIRIGGAPIHANICGGVDHWYALELSGGDVITANLRQPGGLSVQLYGIRAISTVASGKHGLSHRVPLARDNRGQRYLRVVAPSAGAAAVYTLEVNGL